MMLSVQKYGAVLCDIEGTTTSIAFVKDVLFPYCAKNVEEYLKQNIREPSFQPVVQALIEDSKKANQQDSQVKLINDSNDYKTLAENVRHFIQKDLKLTSLKDLQGQMWIDGYKTGAYKSHVYEDTVRLFEQCRTNKIPLFIYSSGSVLAQKLLFQYTERGDLSKFISDYYDTNFGAKTDQKSYSKIANHIRTAPEKILFLTDVDKEAHAAKSAGLNVTILIREGNVPLSEECKKEFQTVGSFDELKF
ncbi:Enolase-phosphatase E1 [Aphelenchoides bicaudatus]|nr:Enolase-phosphatase E1 [Aphelenchoides bicaudatus]